MSKYHNFNTKITPLFFENSLLTTQFKEKISIFADNNQMNLMCIIIVVNGNWSYLVLEFLYNN